MLNAAYPILDFDEDPTDLVSQIAFAEKAAHAVPQTVVMAILGPAIAQYTAENNGEQFSVVDLVTTTYDLWRISREDRQIGILDCPIGGPAAVICAEHLIQRGARTLIMVGSCGALEPIAEGEFLVPYRALRDEGTSYHYQRPGRWISTDETVSATCIQTLKEAGFKAREVSTWTTDGLHRETKQMIADRKAAGCAVVEMETASMAAFAKMRGIPFGQILFTADSLATDEYEPRGWGRGSHRIAMEMAAEAAFRMATPGL